MIQKCYFSEIELYGVQCVFESIHLFGFKVLDVLLQQNVEMKEAHFLDELCRCYSEVDGEFAGLLNNGVLMTKIRGRLPAPEKGKFYDLILRPYWWVEKPNLEHFGVSCQIVDILECGQYI
jgi:hypothetical protein